jgi:hypothetical protein
MSFGGGIPAQGALSTVPETVTAPTPEELARQAQAIRKKRMSVNDLIIEPGLGVQSGTPSPVNTRQ